MELLSKDCKIILRDFLKTDVEDYVIWNTKIIEWQKWDAPWENAESTKEEIKERYEDYYNRINTLSLDSIRTRFEICVNDLDQTHIGWVISYQIDELFKYTKSNGFYALGIDIPDLNHRRKGYGKQALLTYIEYLKSHSINQVYIQTWSGNLSMLILAEKLGFVECGRVLENRYVNGNFYDAITLKLDI